MIMKVSRPNCEPHDQIQQEKNENGSHNEWNEQKERKENENATSYQKQDTGGVQKATNCRQQKEKVLHQGVHSLSWTSRALPVALRELLLPGHSSFRL